MNDVGSTSAVLIVCLLGSVGKKRGGEGSEAGGSIRKIFSSLVLFAPFICERGSEFLDAPVVSNVVRN